jgi:Fungal Zn(2)-Cys(6) binuclear cluster domain
VSIIFHDNGGNMNLNSPSGSGQTMQGVSAAQPPSQATAPSTLLFQAHGRTAIRRRNPTSCNLCRRRKIKCDRADPCSHCVRSKAECVSSVPSRAPRGRQGGRRKLDGELLDRIAKLENLVRHFEAGNTGSTPPVPAALDRNQPV